MIIKIHLIIIQFTFFFAKDINLSNVYFFTFHLRVWYLIRLDLARLINSVYVYSQHLTAGRICSRVIRVQYCRLAGLAHKVPDFHEEE